MERLFIQRHDFLLGGLEALTRTPGGTAIFGFMPVVPITLASALVMGIVSVLTPKPSAETLARYFPAVPSGLAGEHSRGGAR